MDITYKAVKDIPQQSLQALFLSVNWSSGNHPEKLAKAIKNYGTVFTAWQGDELVGLISIMDDGVLNAYIHYLLVRPEYQKQGIGKELLRLTKEHYKSYLRIVLVAYNKELEFYSHCGFKAAQDCSPMFITSLTT